MNYDEICTYILLIVMKLFFEHFLDRQTDRPTDRQTDRQTLWFIGNLHFQKYVKKKITGSTIRIRAKWPGSNSMLYKYKHVKWARHVLL